LIAAEADLPKLRTRMEDLETKARLADDKNKPFLNLFRKKLAARIAELERGGK
jgi:hypothetical protein